jgi:HAD superfamily hydrolase (TIGR01458 family)
VLTDVRGLLIDIDGVLTVGWEPIDGALDAFAHLREAAVPVRLATNTTTRTRAAIADTLAGAGFAVTDEDILTAPTATAAYLATHHPGARCYLLSSGDVTGDLGNVHLVDETEPADVVILGGAGMTTTHERLNHAFSLLLDGAAFVAMHRNLYWRTARGLELDTGAYALALEAASGVTPTVIGKPSPAFFAAGCAALGLEADAVAMIGDDVVNDVLGAQDAGLHGVLVQTGKYRREAVDAAPGDPEMTVASFAEVPGLFL